MRAWELHPALVHFPIAFLTGGVLIDLIARLSRGDPRKWTRVAAGLLVAGFTCGLAAVVTGAVSYFTVPAHTELAHEQMHVHAMLAAGALATFALVAATRWRRREMPASTTALAGGFIGCALLIGAALLGGNLVYRGGAGVDPRILAPTIAKGHHHHGEDGDHNVAAHHEGAARTTESGGTHQERLSDPRRPVAREPPLFDPDEDLRVPRALPSTPAPE